MAGCRHHSGYLADDEAGHSPYMARGIPPKKSLLPEMWPGSRLGYVPHPPSVDGSSGRRGHRQNPKGPQAFGSFLDFLTEGQVLESLQSVVERATERMASMKTGAGVPLVEVQDPMEEPRGRRRTRPSLSTVQRHRTRPSLCTGRPNNYPSCSSSMSDSRSSLTTGCVGSRSRDSDLGAQGLGSLPPVRDRLLVEKNLQRLLRLENRGKGLSQSCSQRDSLLWDSLGSQDSSQWTREQPLSWFSGLLGSSSGTPETSELGPGEPELLFLNKFNKEMKSLLSQPASFDLPGYSALREPHCTLDFLAKHHLFPALQSVVSQAVDKLSGARRPDGCPLYPANSEPSALPLNYDLQLPDSKLAESTEREAYDSLPNSASSPKILHRKNKGRRGSPTVSNAQVATRFKLKVTPTEELNVPSHPFHPRQEVPNSDPRLQKPHMSWNCSQKAQPWHGLHLTLPGPGVTVEMASSKACLRGPAPPPLTSPQHTLSYLNPVLSQFPFMVRAFSPSLDSLCPKVASSRLGLGALGGDVKEYFTHHS